ncbi:hypothetical protein K432DRAFT_392877 [Lepidopterella palustris CBS 459.81]|uniref:Uncharacterized protein n=1 Tax=Lepidopterella palustris CBS 459.81 TaxID=1314670 RepID=A0A8E2EBA5_9PEZI|nr:hypothetical protein K432DRAFT_392877 [Lepidopterella palustris CBS 459.81]
MPKDSMGPAAHGLTDAETRRRAPLRGPRPAAKKVYMTSMLIPGKGFAAQKKMTTASLARGVIAWAFYATRPLSIEKVQVAMAVEAGDDGLLNAEAFPDEAVLLSICCPLMATGPYMSNETRSDGDEALRLMQKPAYNIGPKVGSNISIAALYGLPTP